MGEEVPVAREVLQRALVLAMSERAEQKHWVDTAS